MATNRKILVKGIKHLAVALPLLFIGPITINSAFKNKQNDFYEIVLGIGLLFCILAIFFIFRGVNTIVKSLFEGDKNI